MKRFVKRRWMRFLLWYNDVCPIHGEMTDTDMGGHLYCPRCLAQAREDHQTYLDGLFREFSHTEKS